MNAVSIGNVSILLNMFALAVVMTSQSSCAQNAVTTTAGEGGDAETASAAGVEGGGRFPLAPAGILERAGDNLLAAGNFEGEALRRWSFDSHTYHPTMPMPGGAFRVEPGPGREDGTSARLLNTSTQGRGRFSITMQVPAGDLRFSVWARPIDFKGGIAVHLEGPAAPRNAKFDIAGGTSPWVDYSFRTTIDPDKAGELTIWVLMYGVGEILLDDFEVRPIVRDDGAPARWAEAQAEPLAAAAAAWAGRPDGLEHLAGAIRGPQALEALDRFIGACARGVSGSDAWGVLAAHAAQRVFRDKPFRHAFRTGIDLEMARHEFEGGQLVLFAFDEDLRDVTLSIDHLRGPDGESSADNLRAEILPVAYGQRPQGNPIPWYLGHDTAHWPDALLPNRRFTVERNTVQPVYLRFYSAPETLPGRYTGAVTIESSLGSTSVPVSILVHPVTLPVSLSLRTMSVSGKREKPWIDLALEQRMGIGTHYNIMTWTRPLFPRKGDSYDFSSVEQELQYALDRGLNAFTIAQTPKSGRWGFPDTYSDEWKATIRHAVSAYTAWLKEKGWLDMAYYNNIDEPWHDRHPQVKEIYNMIKAVDPEIKVFSCLNWVGDVEALKDHADVFNVYIQQYGQQQTAARMAEGKEIWWAVCIWPGESPNLFIEYPLMDARIIGWMAYRYGIAGFEYWDLSRWEDDWQPLERKPPEDGSWIDHPEGLLVTNWMYGRRQRRNGDGYLTYPGPDNTPINSLRFEALRDGIEEHELLTQLARVRERLAGRSAAEAARLLEGGDGLVTNHHLFSIDAERLEKARGRLLALLGEALGAGDGQVAAPSSNR